MWVDIEAPEGVTEKDINSCRRRLTISQVGKSRVHLYQQARCLYVHIQRTDVWRVQMTPVKVTINAVAAETENGERRCHNLNSMKVTI